MVSFSTLIDDFSDKRILVIGDVMLDCFVYGSIDRISPEAPAPVIRAKKPSETVGGAGNVAQNIAALGAKCEVISIVGSDGTAKTIANKLQERGITPHLIECPDRISTVKTRFVAHLHNTHILRADWEETKPISSSEEDQVIATAKARLDSVDAVILSDYAKGCLPDRVISEIIDACLIAKKPVIVDPKGSNYLRYAKATVITPNLAELGSAVGRPLSNEHKCIEEAALNLAKATQVDFVLVTRSEHGIAIIGSETESGFFPATARRVTDVSGAGDTVAASFTLALISGATPQNAARLANAAAGIAVAKSGTSQVSCDELREIFLSRPHFEIQSKILSESTRLSEQTQRWRADGFVIGFTNGCFDLLHPGHISLLTEARSRCDRLIVGLNSDSSVKRLKGSTRPIQNEDARSIVMAALSFVDGVVLFEEDTPIELIKRVRPDVLIKGADYRLDQVVGRDFVESYGGKVCLVELVPNSSTSRIVASISSDSKVSEPQKLDFAT